MTKETYYHFKGWSAFLPIYLLGNNDHVDPFLITEVFYQCILLVKDDAQCRLSYNAFMKVPLRMKAVARF